MSLLLDALQRASEEKKKLAESVGDNAGSESGISASAVSAVDAAISVDASAGSPTAPAEASPPFDFETTPARPELDGANEDSGPSSAAFTLSPLEQDAAATGETPAEAPIDAAPIAAAATDSRATERSFAAPRASVGASAPLSEQPPPEPYDTSRAARDIVENVQARSRKRLDPRIAILLAVLLVLTLITAVLFLYSGDGALKPGSMAAIAPEEVAPVAPAEAVPAGNPVAPAELPPPQAKPAQRTDQAPATTTPPPRTQPLITASTASPSPLDRAYQALKLGQLDVADAAYREALRANSGEIDALLGLAYIARSRGDNESAVGRYAQVLRLQPGHPEANAGLLALAPAADLAAALSRVREIVEKNPNSAEAQATFGGLLVRQGRLAEAQQAYFKAYSLDAANPLYAYNLAVALDRLHKYAQAMKFYERTISLVDAQAPAQRSAAIFQLAQQRKAQLLQTVSTGDDAPRE